MENNELWNRITNTLFRKVDVPPPSEIFVQRVMAHLDDEERGWNPWLVPAFGMGFAALFFAAALFPARTEPNAETLLTIDGPAETENQFVASDKAPQNDTVLDYTLEGLQ